MIESQVYLRDGQTSRLVEASLFDVVTPDHLALWETQWVPVMQTHCAGRAVTDRPEDSHWDWRRKSQAVQGILGYHSFSLICQGELQGLMMVNDMMSARLATQFGKPMIYVEFLATAPWNRAEISQSPRYRGVGKVFMLAAVEASREVGFKGRLGLHSLPNAEPFYEARCGMARLGQDSSHQNLTYFEMTETQADQFRRIH